MVVAVVILPLLFMQGNANGPIDWVRYPKQIGLFVLAGLAISFLIYEKLGKELALISGFIIFNTIISGFGPVQQGDLVCYLAALSVGYCFVNRSEKVHNMYFDAMIVGGVMSSIMGYLQILDIDPLWEYVAGVERTLPTAFMGQHTVLGPFLAACAIPALFRKRYWAYAFIVPVIIGTQSSFSYLSLAAGTGVYLYTVMSKRVFMFCFAFSLMTIICALAFTNASYLLANNGRFEVWEATVKCWWEFDLLQKFTGFGFGSYKYLFPKIQPFNTKQYGVFIHAHSEYVQLLFEGGLIGLGILIYTFESVVKKVKAKLSDKYIVCHAAIFTVFTVNSIGNFPMHLSPHAVIALCSLIAIVSPRIGVIE